MSSSDRFETIFFSSGYLPKKCSRVYAPPLALKFWYSPSTASSMRLRSSPLVSRCSSGSQYEPQITFSTFQPAPRNAASSSWMIFAVAAHRAVEPLEIAVDDEDEVVELFARGEGDRAERLGLVHLPVAHERPDLALRGVEQPPVVQVLHDRAW